VSWYPALRALIEARLGVHLREEQPSAALAAFVERRAAELGLRGGAGYVEALEQNADELDALVAVVNNGETCFFRYPEQLEAIMELAASVTGGLPQIWSAGCSTGEEPHSLAMLLAERGVPARVLGTDVNRRALAHAAAGVFSAWSTRHVSPSRRARFFEAAGERWALAPAVRAAVELRAHNLVRETPPRSQRSDGAWDVIVCANVLIYQRPKIANDVLERLAGALAPNGWLFLSAAERPSIPLLVPRLIGEQVGYQTSTRRPPVAALPAVVPAVLETVTAARLIGDAAARICAHDFERAAQTLSEAHALDPLRPEVHYLAGVLHRKLGNLTDAEAALRRALFLCPELWPASFLLAGVHGRLGNVEERRRELGRALAGLESGAASLPGLGPEALEQLVPAPNEVEAICRRELGLRS
jgi:chemotaxis protein methyltransferase CheR